MNARATTALMFDRDTPTHTRVHSDAVRSVYRRLPADPEVRAELAEMIGLLPHLDATGEVVL